MLTCALIPEAISKIFVPPPLFLNETINLYEAVTSVPHTHDLRFSLLELAVY